MKAAMRALLAALALQAGLAGAQTAPARPARPAAEPPAVLRLACEGASAGAEVSINGQFKGECPLDVSVPAGSVSIRAVKKSGGRDLVFEQQLRVGGGVAKRVEIDVGSASPAAAPPQGQVRNAAAPVNADADGCVATAAACSTPPSVDQSGGSVVQVFRNTCPFRVYASVHNGLANGARDSGAQGVAPGAAYRWSSGEADGQVFLRAFGSTQEANDFTCNMKDVPAFESGDPSVAKRRRGARQ